MKPFPRKLMTPSQTAQTATAPTAILKSLDRGITPKSPRSLTDAAIARASNLPPEGTYRGVTVEVREIFKENGNELLIVEVETDEGHRIGDVMVIGAPRPMPSVRAGLSRARQYVELSGEFDILEDWEACKSAMKGLAVEIDFEHIRINGDLRPKVVAVRPAPSL